MKLKRFCLRCRLACAFAVLGSSALLAGVFASTAAASEFTTQVTPNNTFALLLDVSGASTAPGAPVIDWWANGGANQNWTFNSVGPASTYEIINQNSGQCLTTDGVPGDQVTQMPCVGSLQQEWLTAFNPGRGPRMIQSVYSGLYLDVNSDSPWPGASIDTWYYNGNSNQYFSSLFG